MATVRENDLEAMGIKRGHRNLLLLGAKDLSSSIHSPSGGRHAELA